MLQSCLHKKGNYPDRKLNFLQGVHNEFGRLHMKTKGFAMHLPNCLHTRVGIQKKRPNKMQCIICQNACAQDQSYKRRESAMHYLPNCLHTSSNIQKKRPNKVQCIICQTACTQDKTFKAETRQSAMHYLPNCLHTRLDIQRRYQTICNALFAKLACTQK